MTDAALREAEVVIRRAEQEIAGGRFSPLHELGEQVALAYDRALQTAVFALCQTTDDLSGLIATRPEQFIAALAGAAFVTGIALRIWRSHA